MTRVRKGEPLPYYRWFWRDFRANRKVQRMSWQARGLYRELLDEFWAEGSLPNDLEKLADICGCKLSEMKQLWPEIEPCWELWPEGFRNAKMDEQRTDADYVRAQNAANGRSGGRAKAANAKRPLANGSDRYDSASERHIAFAVALAVAEQEHKQEGARPPSPEVGNDSSSDQAEQSLEGQEQFTKASQGLEDISSLDSSKLDNTHEISASSPEQDAAAIAASKAKLMAQAKPDAVFSDVEQERTKAAMKLIKEHPRPEYGTVNVADVVDLVELLAVERGQGKQEAYEYLLGRVKLYRDKHAVWPKEERQFIPRSKHFFERELFRQDESTWERYDHADANDRPNTLAILPKATEGAGTTGELVGRVFDTSPENLTKKLAGFRPTLGGAARGGAASRTF